MYILYALLLFTAVSLVKNTADGLEFEDSDDDEYCTDDDCEDDDSNLQLYLDSSKQGQSWLSYYVKDTLSSATGVRNVLNVLTGLKGIIGSARRIIIQNVNKKYEQVYSTASELVNNAKKFIMHNLNKKYEQIYNTTAELVYEAKEIIIYNLNQKYEQIYNTTAELVYEAKEIIMHNLDKSYEQLYKYYEEIKNTTREFGQKVYDKAANFSERVRVVFREEFNNFLETIWEYGLGESVANDSLFRRFQKTVVDRLLIIGLIIFCLILDYIVWKLSTSILVGMMWIMTFDSGILLAYKLLGSHLVYWAIWIVVEYTWYILTYMWAYPYTSACVICVLFVLSVGYFIYEKIRRRRRREWKSDQITIINERLRRLEEQQNEKFGKIEQQLNELLKRKGNRH